MGSENDVLAKHLNAAFNAFENLTGRLPNAKEARSIRNKITWRVQTMPPPKGEIRLHKGFGILNNREAWWWHVSTIRAQEKLLHLEAPSNEYIRGAHTFHIDNDPKKDYSKDTEVIAEWNGRDFLDPNDGVPVVFGRNQWAG